MASVSFDNLFRENEGRVRAYIIRLIRDAGEAEDLTQETFIRARAGLDAFRGDSSVSTWLYAIATNVCLDFLKSAGRRRLQVTPPEILAEIAATDEESLRFSSDLLLDRDAMGNCVRRLMDQIPTDQRMALLLHDIEEMTNSEVAKEMDCSVANAKIRLHRARKKVRAVLEENCVFSHDTQGVFVCEPKSSGDSSCWPAGQ
jgi:RNA polymerase sigma-70 factor (ECF subfamily)